MNFDKKIIEIRKKHNLTQEDLAEKLNVSRQTVSNWETNKCYPDIETLVIISNKFNISLDILIKENEKMFKDIDKKIRIGKKLKYSVLVLVFLLLIGGIVIYAKSNKIDSVLAKNNELQEEVKQLTEVKDGNLVYSFKTKNIDIKNISLDYHNVDIYSNDKLIAKDIKVLNYKDKDGNVSSSSDSLEYIYLEVSDDTFTQLKQAEYKNEKIGLKNSN